MLSASPKALSYMLFKKNICLERYLYQVANIKHKKALSRFRLSNHVLQIEKGRHMRPPLERSERKCFVCINEVENEIHFLIQCPLYNEEREILFQICRRNCRLFDSLNSDELKFIYIMTSEDVDVTMGVAKFVWDSFNVRDKALQKS